MITIYSKKTCVFCDKAKTLLDNNGLEYIEKVLGVDATREELLELAPDAKTVPQIFNDSKYIGGYIELTEWLDKHYRS